MLAIMNIGKYSSSGIVPSGSDLFTISANQSLGQAIDFYARKGNTILGLPYRQNTIYRSTNGGASWETVSSPYYLAHIFYSSIEDKFYALELGDKNTTELHYGYSTDGESWTWESLYTVTSSPYHIYGTFIEEVSGEVVFDVFYIEPTATQVATDTAIASHIRVDVNGNESLIGSSVHLRYISSGSGTYRDFYPILSNTYNLKTKNAVLFNGWYADDNGTERLSVENKLTVGSWGINAQTPWYNQGYASDKCFDKFYNTSGTVSSGNVTERYDYSETTRSNTWVTYSKSSVPSANAFYKVYGFFQLGNYFYMAYQRYSNMNTVWYRAGDVNSLIDVLAEDTFNKADLTGIPVSEYSIDSKHFLISMADGKVYLCEAT